MRRHPVADVSVARVLSQAPASLCLTPAGARALLQRNFNSVTRSVHAARRSAAGDTSVMQPVPEPGTDFLPPAHAANSCYIAATLAAVFAQWDAWDALLSPPPGGDSSRIASLRALLREMVNVMRTGGRVRERTVDRFRSSLIGLGFHAGRGQQDATDLFVLLVDWLGAPLLPFGVSLVHEAMRDAGDERMDTERILWLPVPPEGGGAAAAFGGMLDAFFFGERREGLRRALPRREAIVDAWCFRLLLPEYTPSKGKNDRMMKNSFDTLAMPFAIKRYNAAAVKQRTPVEIPLKVDFTKYVNSTSEDETYTLSLRSVVCHIGARIGAGHYVAYTYDQTAWRRWDDLQPGVVPAVEEDARGLPSDPAWREEVLRDSYMIFYELVPGDGTEAMADMLDASSSGGASEFGRNQFFYNELMQRRELDFDFHVARQMQAEYDSDLARRQSNTENAEYERQLVGMAQYGRSGSSTATSSRSRASSTASAVSHAQRTFLLVVMALMRCKVGAMLRGVT